MVGMHADRHQVDKVQCHSPWRTREVAGGMGGGGDKHQQNNNKRPDLQNRKQDF